MERVQVYKSDLMKLKQIDCIGAEANLYINHNTVYKIYRDDCSSLRLQLIKGKLEALLEDENIMSIANMNFPEKAVYIGESFAGITQPYLEGYRNLKEMEYNNKNIISIFKKLSTTLKELHKNDTFIGDLNGKNIMYKDKTVKFVDVDGIYYDGCMTYSYSTILDHYNIDGPSKFSDTFALAHLALDLLTNHTIRSYSYSNFHERVMNLNLPKELEFFEGILLDFDESYVGDYMDILKEYKYSKEKNTFVKRKTI